MPASDVNVGSKSIAPDIGLTTCPAGNFAGQRRKQTLRTPPSSTEPFTPFMPPL